MIRGNPGQEIVDDGDLRKYRTEVPNMADDELDPYQYRLYAHYKRVGNCCETVRTTAEKTRMSVTKVIETRDWLALNGWISVTVRSNTTMNIRVLDRWPENFKRYSEKRQAGVPNMEQGVPNMESKKEPIKKEPVQKTKTLSASAEKRGPLLDAIVEAGGLDGALQQSYRIAGGISKKLPAQTTPEAIKRAVSWWHSKNKGKAFAVYYLPALMCETGWHDYSPNKLFEADPSYASGVYAEEIIA